MARRLLDYDPLSGVYTYHDYDDLTRRTTIETVQDVEPFLEVNRALYREDDYSRRGKKNEWWHVATIPVVAQEKLLRDHGLDVFNKDHWPGVRRMLNSPEWEYLRTSKGTI